MHGVYPATGAKTALGALRKSMLSILSRTQFVRTNYCRSDPPKSRVTLNREFEKFDFPRERERERRSWKYSSISTAISSNTWRKADLMIIGQRILAWFVSPRHKNGRVAEVDAYRNRKTDPITDSSGKRRDFCRGSIRGNFYRLPSFFAVARVHTKGERSTVSMVFCRRDAALLLLSHPVEVRRGKKKGRGGGKRKRRKKSPLQRR